MAHDEDSIGELFATYEPRIEQLEADAGDIANDEVCEPLYFLIAKALFFEVEKLISEMERLKSIVEQFDLVSSNDSLDDIPTISLRFLRFDAYIGRLLEERATPIEKREAQLKEAKVRLLYIKNQFSIN